MKTLMCMSPLFTSRSSLLLMSIQHCQGFVRTAVRIFDQCKSKCRDQGAVNLRVNDVLDLELGGHGV